jgi:hypothetical protein
MVALSSTLKSSGFPGNRMPNQNAPTSSLGTDRTGILIVGMHGGSLGSMARIFNLLGADLPTSLSETGARSQDKGGESRAIRELNDRLLTAAGSRWNDWRAVATAKTGQRADEYRAQAQALLASEFRTGRLAVLQDARISRLLPFWLEAFGAAGMDPHLVCVLHTPLAVASVLAAGYDYPVEFTHLLWLRHMLDAEALSRGRRRIFVDHARMLADWPAQTGRIAAALPLVWPSDAATAAPWIAAVLAEEGQALTEAGDVTGNPLLHEWVRDTYRILERWCAGREDVADHARLDVIRTEFGKTGRLFSPLVSRGQKAIAELRAKTEAVARLTSAAAEDRRRIEALEAGLVVGHGADTPPDVAAALQRALAERDAALAQARAAPLQGSSDASLSARIEAQVRPLMQDLQAAVQRQADLQAAHDAELRDRDAALARMVRAETTLRAELEAANAEITRLTDANAARTSEIVRLTKILRQTEEKHGSAAALQETTAARLARAEAEFAAERAAEAARWQAHEAETAARLAALSEQVEYFRHTEAALRRDARSQADSRRIAAALLARPANPRLQEQADLLRHSMLVVAETGLFDAAWYLEVNSDVAQAGADPLNHFVAYGLAEGRAPNDGTRPETGAQTEPQTGPSPVTDAAARADSWMDTDSDDVPDYVLDFREEPAEADPSVRAGKPE